MTKSLKGACELIFDTSFLLLINNACSRRFLYVWRGRTSRLSRRCPTWSEMKEYFLLTFWVLLSVNLTSKGKLTSNINGTWSSLAFYNVSVPDTQRGRISLSDNFASKTLSSSTVRRENHMQALLLSQCITVLLLAIAYNWSTFADYARQVYYAKLTRPSPRWHSDCNLFISIQLFSWECSARIMHRILLVF